MLDLVKLGELIEQSVTHMVTVEHGRAGAEALRLLLQSVLQLFRAAAPENLEGTLTVFVAVGPEHSLSANAYQEFASFEVIGPKITSSCAIEILPSGLLRLWPSVTPDPLDLAQRSVVYVFSQGSEHVFARSATKPLPKVVIGRGSILSAQGFLDLREALEHYGAEVARQSACEKLSQSWAEEARLFVAAGVPERHMRDSLVSFLRHRIRGVKEVRPEQNTDATRPVDIKVTWTLSNRLALIEIKWLGVPKHSDGHLGAGYYDARARAGAAQLADYLDLNRPEAPLHVTRGYLVVFDARRSGLTEATQTLNRENGFAYEHREIEYDPKFHEVRTDFDVPLRFFIEPVCN